MIQSKQPSLEDLKAQTLSIKYVVADVPPKEGLKRLHYYLYKPSNPKEHYFGWSFRTAHTKEEMTAMIDNGSVVLLTPSVQIEYKDDLFMDSEGRIVIANGAEPWEGKRRIVSAPKALRKANVILRSNATKDYLPKIYTSHSFDE